MLGRGAARPRLDVARPAVRATDVLLERLAARRTLGHAPVTVGVAGNVGQDVTDRPARQLRGCADVRVGERSCRREEPLGGGVDQREVEQGVRS
jgi:hypothetical protein